MNASKRKSMEMFDLENHPHRRYNPLNDSWILCSPHRSQRPWQGQQEKTFQETRPEYDSKCYLCPGNHRVGHGNKSPQKNPNYRNTFSFTNDFAALLEDTPKGEVDEEGLIKAFSVRGTSRVICFSPKHNLTIAQMCVDDIRIVIEEWQKQFRELSQQFKYVQIFENKGAVMGCSNPHPHGQVWATETIPEEPSKELKSFQKHFDSKKTCLLCDYLQLESSKKERIVFENSEWVALVPFWAYWPFELLILPKKHCSTILEFISSQSKTLLASLLKTITASYDMLFQCSFPYSMGIHQSPVDPLIDETLFHLHFHFYPPLLRSASVKKFLVGYEMVGELCRDITAEQAAQRLASLCQSYHSSV